MLIRTVPRVCLALAVVLIGGCRRASGIPPVPDVVPQSADAEAAALARSLAPILYVQRDESFPLERVVAVVHPDRPIVAYILAWRWDVNGQWLPWAKSSDEEEVWVGYDPATRAPTDVWTYWHGRVLHADWHGRGQPAASVQWGKHGSLPHGVIESDLPHPQTLNMMYAIEFLLLPDIWMGKLMHGGPWGFFHGYARYRDFSRVIPLAERLSAIVCTSDSRPSAIAVLGTRFSKKLEWPDEDTMVVTPTKVRRDRTAALCAAAP
ncbi:MAG TPA: hypothetical protein VHV78_11865 [Gemmatimonadaceae bacterium]|jgi:hypothetical protein|nr:hypothetical protein [Gemmatimonadaceae bacterium]